MTTFCNDADPKSVKEFSPDALIMYYMIQEDVRSDHLLSCMASRGRFKLVIEARKEKSPQYKKFEGFL